MGGHWQRPPIVPDKYAMTAAIVSPGDSVLTGNHLKIINLPTHGMVFHGLTQFDRFIHPRMILLVTSFSIIDALSQPTVFESLQMAVIAAQ